MDMESSKKKLAKTVLCIGDYIGTNIFKENM